MIDFTLNKQTLHIERENAFSMIEGFIGGTKNRKCCIFTAHGNAKSIQNNFNNFPKLITVIQKTRQKYPPSKVGKIIADSKYDIKYKYIAILDTTYYLHVNKFHMWEEICKIGNGLFEQWKPDAPFNSLKDKSGPRILFLRVCEIDKIFIDNKDMQSITAYYKTIKQNHKVNVIKPVVNNDLFIDVQNRLEGLISPYTKHKTINKDTIRLFEKNNNQEESPHKNKGYKEQPIDSQNLEYKIRRKNNNLNNNQEISKNNTSKYNKSQSRQHCTNNNFIGLPNINYPKTAEKYDSKFKADLALKIINKEMNIEEVYQKYGIHKDTIIEWMNTIINKAHTLFEDHQ